MFQAFPLQHKKMTRLSLPFLKVGACEVLNSATRDHMSSFAVHNTRNRGAHVVATNTGCGSISPEAVAPPSTSPVPFMSDVVAGGLCDSFTGSQCSRYIGNYLARALGIHCVLPEGIAQLRRELKEDPIIDIMMSALSCERLLHSRKSHTDKNAPFGFRRVFSEREMQQYAMFADNAFMNACRSSETLEGLTEENALRNSEAANCGCRAVWFTASVAPFLPHVEEQRERKQEMRQGDTALPSMQGEAKTQGSKNTGNGCRVAPPTSPFCLDVLVSNVGDSRAFGIARHVPLSGVRGPWDATREPVIPLSSDHKPLRTQELRRILSAGGVVRSDVGDIIDGNPFYNVSRSFGHWSMKSDPRRPPSEQKIIALPECSSWEMMPGDVLVLCNHATFETRCMEESSMDEIAKLVGREIDRGAAPEEAAAALCNYAVRFGAGHSLQVMIAVATAVTSAHAPCEAPRQEWVVPGPIYAEPCRRSPEYRKALLVDCERCGVSLAELLELRWRQVRNLLPSRHALPLMAYYGKECSVLQQMMDEEALLFTHGSLPPEGCSEDALVKYDKGQMRRTFEKIANSLLAPNGQSVADSPG
ncbi:putative protein phosphatase 2C [Trypanosoma conorhini]|uniref:PPM-type phosphatase domain-containing protein n=1 Tax=Trypanosoma conorhini TaxID=83891 RepID=A0A3R7L1R0_9TRYP|nr:putative protein phosphatase 2C [Trypanosoma conorhini]RNF17911.1 putative protein phosphatase 2C [Trypanosoma conorhini]